MSQSMSAQARSAREQARKADGKFGEQTHDRAAGIDLYDTDWMSEDQDTGQEDTGGVPEPAWDPDNVPRIQSVDPDRVFTDRRLLTRTPTDQWGRINNRYEIATGITEVSCEGHGGVGLSAERNAAIPEPLRNADGWYEEDCEYYIVAATFPAEFQRGGSPYFTKRTVDEISNDASSRVAEWFPYKYEQATGVTIPPGVSRSKDGDVWVEAHRDEFVAEGASRREDGRVTVTVRRRSDDSTTYIVMDRDEHKARGEGRGVGPYRSYVVDMETAELDTERIAEADAEQREKRRRNRELMDRARTAPWEDGRDTLTDRERRRLDTWMRGLVRTHEGEVLERSEWMAREKVTAVQQMSDGKWYVDLAPESEDGSASYCREVPAVVAKASRRAGLPDETREATRKHLREERREKRERAEKRRSWGW